MKNLREETNSRILNMFSREELTLDVLKSLSKEVKDTSTLKDLSNRCHAAIIQILWEADPVINLEGTEYVINISRGGAAIPTKPRTATAKTFDPRRDLSMTLYLDPLDPTSEAANKFIYIVDLLENRVQVVESGDDNMLRTIADIVECYHYAFERLHFGEEVATKRKTARANALARKQEEEELKQALENGDTETINRIAEAQHNRQGAAEETGKENAKRLGRAATKQVKDIVQPSVTDTLSFVYGWLAGNVEYLYAKLPGWNKFAEGDFLRYYPGVRKVDASGKPGYWINDPIKKTTGGFKYQLYSEYHVHFKHGVIQKAPECVKAFLNCFISNKTGTASILQGDTASKAIARYLISDLGFWFDRTENTDAYRTCKAMANNKEDFELGYNWVESQKAANAAERRTARKAAKATVAEPASVEASDFNPEVEAEVNPLNQEFPDSEM
jgi:hypothetical protein